MEKCEVGGVRKSGPEDAIIDHGEVKRRYETEVIGGWRNGEVNDFTHFLLLIRSGGDVIVGGGGGVIEFHVGLGLFGGSGDDAFCDS